MSYSAPRIAIAAVVALGVSALHAQHGLPPLQADIDTTYATAGSNPFTVHGRYYRAQDGRVREDSPIGATIIDPAGGTVTLLNFATKEARVLSVPRPLQAAREVGRPQAFTRFGDATIEGHAVAKLRTKDAGGRDQELWNSDELGLTVYSRTQSTNLVITKSHHDFAFREPDPNLFQIPKDYKVEYMKMPAAASPRVPPLPSLPPIPPASRP